MCVCVCVCVCKHTIYINIAKIAKNIISNILAITIFHKQYTEYENAK